MGDRRLEIHIGVPKIPGDIYSNEPDVKVLILLGSYSGFSFPTGQVWQPKRAQLKNGGSYIDSATTNGSEPSSFAYQNVTESIELDLTITGNDVANGAIELDENIAELQRFIDMAQRFSTTYAQTTPVYLLYQDPYAPGEQYALMLGCDMVAIKDPNNPLSARITLNMTRVPFWEEDPPFSNPKLRSLRVNNTPPTPTNVNLISKSDDLVSATVQMRHEYDSADYAGTPLSQNWVDIPGDLITGDAPALVQIMVARNPFPAGTPTKVLVGVSSKPEVAFDTNGDVVRNAYSFNMGDADFVGSSGGITLSKVNGGLISNGSSVNQFRIFISATASAAGGEIRIGPENGSADPFIPLSRQILRGRYAVFVRGGQASVAAMRATLSYYEGVNAPATSARIPIGEFTIPIEPHVISYAGELNIAIGSRSSVGINGLGLESTENKYSTCGFTITNIVNPVASAQTAYLIDIILLPIDEGSLYATYTENLGPQATVLDGTGYLLRDKAPFTKSVFKNTLAFVQDEYKTMLTIGFLELKPKTDYRMYFLMTTNFSSFRVEMDANFLIGVNLKPRWIGIRSE